MKFITDKTICNHKKFGKGVYKRHDGKYIVVEFSTGEMTLSPEIIDKGIMTINNVDEQQENASEPIPKTAQTSNKIVNTKALISVDGYYEIDDTDYIIGGNKIWEFNDSYDKLSFNSSFCVIGKNIRVSRIRAIYDLIIIGDVQVAEVIEVKGNLFVCGKIEANAIIVGNEFTCSSKVVANRVEAGTNILVKDIKCNDVVCGGNIMAENDIDVKCVKTNRTILSGGGIYSDNIYSQNTIAVDLIECDGERVGNIIDLSDSTIPIQAQVQKSGESLRDLDYRIIKEIAKLIQEKYGSSVGDISNYLKHVAKLEASKLCDMNSAYQYLTEIIELSSISNLRDYIILQYCKNTLMLELLNNPIIRRGYERLDVVTVADVRAMEFKARDLGDFVFCLKIVNEQQDMFDNMQELILDKIFQSIGIKYNTVREFIY